MAYPEAYSGPSRISQIESFVKIINDSKPLTTFTKSSILDVCEDSKYASDKGWIILRNCQNYPGCILVLLFEREIANC